MVHLFHRYDLRYISALLQAEAGHQFASKNIVFDLLVVNSSILSYSFQTAVGNKLQVIMGSSCSWLFNTYDDIPHLYN